MGRDSKLRKSRRGDVVGEDGPARTLPNAGPYSDIAWAVRLAEETVFSAPEIRRCGQLYGRAVVEAAARSSVAFQNGASLENISYRMSNVATGAADITKGFKGR